MIASATQVKRKKKGIEKMKSVSIAHLKNRLSAYLNEVKDGNEIVVRDRNRAIARIVPLSQRPDLDEELAALAAQGKIRLGDGQIDGSFWSLPAPRVRTEVLRQVTARERVER